MCADNNPLLFVTGLSGAGISSALKHLEDLGYEVFDNFPLALLNALLAAPDLKKRPVAIGLDTRTRGFDPVAILEQAKKRNARLLFLTADEGVLQKRFTETRRRHPMALDRPVSAGIKKELEWLWILKSDADIVIDTTELSIHDLRHMLDGYFSEKKDGGKLTVTLMSFGFRNGLPREADIVMDVRFLKNPNWIPDLKHLTGLYEAVGRYVEKDEAFAPFINNFKNLLVPLLPRYRHEGKSYLTIAIGCTGGKHRSVYTVETLRPWLEAQGLTTHSFHRDIERAG